MSHVDVPPPWCGGGGVGPPVRYIHDIIYTIYIHYIHCRCHILYICNKLSTLPETTPNTTGGESIYTKYTLYPVYCAQYTIYSKYKSKYSIYAIYTISEPCCLSTSNSKEVHFSICAYSNHKWGFHTQCLDPKGSLVNSRWSWHVRWECICNYIYYIYTIYIDTIHILYRLYIYCIFYIYWIYYIYTLHILHIL